jgi:carbonic anhydrase
MLRLPMRFSSLALSLAISFASSSIACGGATPAPRAGEPKPHASWSYAGENGPAHWGELDPAFALCASGKSQSPIDLPAQPTRRAPVPARPQWDPVPLVPRNTGHTIQIDDTAPSSFVVDGTTYALAQFHFHSPAEHTIAGRTYDAEMHLVHKSPAGKLLVVAIFFERGTENATLKPEWDAMPMQVGHEPVASPGVAIDVAALLPKAPRYLRYDGSLTAPPCSEGVTWMVVEPDASAPTQLSAEQIAKLQAATRGATNRPLQSRGDREVIELAP